MILHVLWVSSYDDDDDNADSGTEIIDQIFFIFCNLTTDSFSCALRVLPGQCAYACLYVCFLLCTDDQPVKMHHHLSSSTLVSCLCIPTTTVLWLLHYVTQAFRNVSKNLEIGSDFSPCSSAVNSDS